MWSGGRGIAGECTWPEYVKNSRGKRGQCGLARPRVL